MLKRVQSAHMELKIHCQAEQQHVAIANQYSNTRLVQANSPPYQQQLRVKNTPIGTAQPFITRALATLPQPDPYEPSGSTQCWLDITDAQGPYNATPK